jgi:hypothetical protein
MSRVQRAQAAPGVSMATSRRTAAAYQPKTAHPFMTAIMILNTVVFAFAASIAAVMMTRGSYDKDSGNRIIPPFLSHKSPLQVYKTCYQKTPGDPKDSKPVEEYEPQQGGGAQ